MNKSNNEIKINGHIYSSYREVCQNLGLNYNTLAVARRRKNMSWEEIILEYYQKGSPRQILYRGVTYQSAVQLCECYNVTYSVFILTKNNLGLTAQETMDYMLSRKVLIDGVYYNSYTEACNCLNISYNSVVKYHARHKELSTEEVILYFKNLPMTADGSRRNVWAFEYKGVRYESLADACRKCGYSLTYARSVKRQYGYSNEDTMKFLERKFQV